MSDSGGQKRGFLFLVLNWRNFMGLIQIMMELSNPGNRGSDLQVEALVEV